MKNKDSNTVGGNQLGKIPCCPKEDVKGFVEGSISGSVGIYWGSKGKVTFPIYPIFKAPNFTGSIDTGVYGGEIKASATGKILITGPATTSDVISTVTSPH
ncbi:hypothetical protein MHK_001583 [Candidatus Magnetomorum sp. HK-1]|nr:hypothetical protein MHK_001583 [Candidatus Magnetomorum sp. HK-1]